MDSNTRKPHFSWRSHQQVFAGRVSGALIRKAKRPASAPKPLALSGTDLEGADSARRRWALQALTSDAIRHGVQFTDARRNLLLGLLDAAPDPATLALDILFALDLTSDCLPWCWSVLRRADHPLADAVRKKLDGVEEVKGDRPTLALLDEGLRDHALRSTKSMV
jgi:hypothetical protein